MTKGSANKSTVTSYSDMGAGNYEDPMNKNFLYGVITKDFIGQIDIDDDVETVLDIGCGTGFVFDERRDELLARNIKCIGVEPAAGMLDIAREKYKEFPRFSFFEGSFETLPLEDNSVDKITSTLALHWVKSLKVAAEEMSRVLKPSGSLDILMIAKDDGAEFKKAIVEALKKHLTFKQVMTTATLVQRATAKFVEETFEPYFPGYDIDVTEHRGVVYGTFEDHMKWWTARSTPVLAEVEDKESFMDDLRVEMEKANTDKGIPFDSAYHHIRLTGEK